MRTAKSKTNDEKHGIYESDEKHVSYENYNSHASHNSQKRMLAPLAAEGAEMLAGIREMV